MRSNACLAYYTTCERIVVQLVSHHLELLRVWEIFAGSRSNLFSCKNCTKSQLLLFDQTEGSKFKPRRSRALRNWLLFFSLFFFYLTWPSERFLAGNPPFLFDRTPRSNGRVVSRSDPQIGQQECRISSLRQNVTKNWTIRVVSLSATFYFWNRKPPIKQNWDLWRTDHRPKRMKFGLLFRF